MKSKLWFALVLTWSATVLLAQDPVGTWQGTLTDSNGNIRIAMKVTRGPSGVLEGQLFNVDRGIARGPVRALSVEGSAMEFAIGDMTFAGQFAKDGNSIVGRLRQGANGTLLTLVRATPETSWPLPAPPKP